MVERLTGRSVAGGTPVEINLTVPADTLFAGSDEPAQIDGIGPIPAPAARDLATQPDAPVWLRRVFTRPESGVLIALESRRRLFTAGQRRFITLRDQLCSTPWCEAPVRHIDHVVPHADGGPTSIDNAQGLCQTCNLAKEAPGWRARPGPAGTITITTPTGHMYRSRPPNLPSSRPPRSPGGRRIPRVVVDVQHWHHAAA